MQITWTFIQWVDYDENRELSWEIEHSFQTFHKSGIAGLFRAIMTRFVQLVKDISAMFIVVTKLEKEGSQQSMEPTLRGILEIKVVVSNQA